MKVDAICYGSVKSVGEWSDFERFLGEVLKSIPKDIMDAFHAERRKHRADELRLKADAIERGEAVS